MRNPILVALDVSDAKRVASLIEQLAPVVGGFKVGKELFVRQGPDLIRQLRAQGSHVFLDLKFHDIPNTVMRAVEAAVALDVQMLTVHTSGGRAMLEAAEQAARQSAAAQDREPPVVLGVTVLTSLNQGDLHELGIEVPLSRQVERLARLATASGLRGLVCSPLELAFLRGLVPKSCQLVSPGIRTADAPADDQKRTLSAREALQSGADWLVIGRPLYAADDPRKAAEAILAGLPSAE